MNLLNIAEVSGKDFFEKLSLYQLVLVDETNFKEMLLSKLFYIGPMDFYCPQCGKESTFMAVDNWPSSTIGSRENARLAPSGRDYYRRIYAHPLITRKFFCVRSPAHVIYFSYLLMDEHIVKVGQYPSIADFLKPHRNKYREVLKEENLRELSKAIGLYAHGIGIGSFIYLRRIFEALVEESHTKAKSKPGWKEKDYIGLRMNERILTLKEYLPEFLVDNRGIYSILSKGVHELSEEECLNNFPIVLAGIELILDEKIVQLEKEEKIKSVEKALRKIADGI